jgi:hypothetical protein
VRELTYLGKSQVEWRSVTEPRLTLVKLVNTVAALNHFGEALVSDRERLSASLGRSLAEDVGTAAVD